MMTMSRSSIGDLLSLSGCSSSFDGARMETPNPAGQARIRWAGGPNPDLRRA